MIRLEMPTHIVAVAGLVENENAEILLVKTNFRGWECPGGQVEVGENLVDALVREVKEESGIDIEVGRLLGVCSNTSTYKWYDGVTDVPTKVMFDFLCKSVSGELTTSDETSDCRFVPKDQVMGMVQAPAARARFEAYLQSDGRPFYMEYSTRPEFALKQSRTF